ncbi:MAG: hypothetical protein U0270_12140 [Labilithrix sp.]
MAVRGAGLPVNRLTLFVLGGVTDVEGAPATPRTEVVGAIAAPALLPAYPLDGGRLLRAAVWRASGDVDRATRYAAWSGQVVGWALVLGGIALALSHLESAGLLAAVVGWFVASASAQGYERVARLTSG